MYRILIVDDEPIVREGLYTFPWEEIDCAIVGEATDGVDGLEMLPKCHPHIVITDIKMPGINGIEFARQGKQLLPETEFIILTGYADFQLVRESLQAHVSDYLLKPFQFDDIKRALLPAIHRIQSRQEEAESIRAMEKQIQSALPLLREQLFQELLAGNLPADSKKLEICQIPKQRYIVFSAQADARTQDLHDLALYGILQHAIESFHEVFYLAGGIDLISCILCFKPEKEGEQCQAAALTFCQLIQQAVQETGHFTISIGISLVSDDIFALPKLREQSVKALNEKYNLGTNLIMLYSDIKEDVSSSPTDYSPLERQLQKSILNKDSDSVSDQFRRLAASVLSSHPTRNESRMILTTILLHTIHFISSASDRPEIKWEDFIRLTQLETTEAFVDTALTLLLQLTQGGKDDSRQYLTDKIIAYIEANYKDDLSLNTLSLQLNYSVPYLSRLIKKNCGKNFSDILLDCRMQHAEELLKNTDHKVNQIAHAVGYRDISYFISVFKKKTGITPNDYRTLYYFGK